MRVEEREGKEKKEHVLEDINDKTARLRSQKEMQKKKMVK